MASCFGLPGVSHGPPVRNRVNTSDPLERGALSFRMRSGSVGSVSTDSLIVYGIEGEAEHSDRDQDGILLDDVETVVSRSEGVRSSGLSPASVSSDSSFSISGKNFDEKSNISLTHTSQPLGRPPIARSPQYNGGVTTIEVPAQTLDCVVGNIDKYWFPDDYPIKNIAMEIKSFEDPNTRLASLADSRPSGYPRFGTLGWSCSEPPPSHLSSDSSLVYSTVSSASHIQRYDWYHKTLEEPINSVDFSMVRYSTDLDKARFSDLYLNPDNLLDYDIIVCKHSCLVRLKPLSSKVVSLPSDSVCEVETEYSFEDPNVSPPSVPEVKAPIYLRPYLRDLAYWSLREDGSTRVSTNGLRYSRVQFIVFFRGKWKSFWDSSSITHVSRSRLF